MGGTLANGNIQAPPWMMLSNVVGGVQDAEYDLTPQVAVTIGAAVSSSVATFLFGNQLPIDSDDFLVREIQWYVTASDGALNPQDLRVRIRDGDGRLFTSDFVQICDLTGPLCPPWPLCRSTNLLFDFQNVNATTGATITVCLKGWKRRPCPSQQAIISPYVPMWKRYTVPADPSVELDDFEYPFTFSSSVAQDLLKVPLPTDNDADFLWRGLAGDWNTDTNDVAVVGSVAVTFYNQGSLPLNQFGLVNPWGSLQAGEFRELVFSSGGGRVAAFFPEILIPRGSVALVDLSFGGPATLRFSLRGMKVYTQCR
jgi:hypothetical protein